MPHVAPRVQDEPRCTCPGLSMAKQGTAFSMKLQVTVLSISPVYLEQLAPAPLPTECTLTLWTITPGQGVLGLQVTCLVQASAISCRMQRPAWPYSVLEICILSATWTPQGLAGPQA